MTTKMYKGEIPYSRKTKIKAALAYTIVAFISILLFTATAHADGIFVDPNKAFMDRQARIAYGEYLNEGDTRTHCQATIFYMASSAKKMGRDAYLMGRIYILAESLDKWYESFGITTGFRSLYWSGVEFAARGTDWSLSNALRQDIAGFYARHQTFFQTIFKMRCKEALPYDFTADFLSAYPAE